jgi:F-type H+-transporting ATPase subunit delta
MAEFATIARPYAEALFQAAGSQAQQVAGWLQELAEIAQAPELTQFAASPVVSVKQVMDVVLGVMKAQPTSHLQGFLQLVAENDRLAVLPEIAHQFRQLQNQQQGETDAVVFSAFALDAAQLADLSGVLETKFKRKLNLSVTLDPELIGGVRVVVGDEVFDTSVKAHLEQMKVALTA